MTTSLGALVLGTPDPPALADFYRALLGWEEVERGAEWVRLRSLEQERPGLSFQLEAGHTAPVWPPRPGPQQMQAHLDVQVDDLDVETARACAPGCDDRGTPAGGRRAGPPRPPRPPVLPLPAGSMSGVHHPAGPPRPAEAPTT
ncbi:VOC family protein [Streptomyces sp. NPDC090231]|uniref:VOC family protein n=1 Tax=unclassified Streptomyces TaxID=2593676 RepID=UPI003811AAEA